MGDPRVQKILKKAGEDLEILAVFLCGSRARGEAGAHPDVDLCLVFFPALWDRLHMAQRRLEYLAEAEENLDIWAKGGRCSFVGTRMLFMAALSPPLLGLFGKLTSARFRRSFLRSLRSASGWEISGPARVSCEFPLFARGLRLGLPADEDDLFGELAQAKVLFPQDGGDLRKMKGRRNILVRVDDRLFYLGAQKGIRLPSLQSRGSRRFGEIRGGP
ncbi:MAG: nucleotidyltransferase domain-containing protein [Candidatus Bipolaricaulaceae bacterium]